MDVGRTLRISWRVLQALAVVFAIAFLDYYLPAKDVVRIVGTDVKRMDVTSGGQVKEGTGQTFERTRDVRFINTVWPSGKPRVYRNEETDWDFPWYFKFDSGNLQATAQNLVSTANDPRWVLVTHYGWRVEILSMFPNVVGIKPVPSADYFSFPWFRTGFFILLAVGIYFVWRAWRRFKLRNIDPMMEEVEIAAAEAEHAAGGLRHRIARWFTGSGRR